MNLNAISGARDAASHVFQDARAGSKTERLAKAVREICDALVSVPVEPAPPSISKPAPLEIARREIEIADSQYTAGNPTYAVESIITAVRAIIDHLEGRK